MEGEPVFYLCYASERKSTTMQKDVDAILASSLKNNSKNNISGFLLYSDDRFMQFLEGKDDDVLDTYAKIKQDSRHRNVTRITAGHAPSRSFPDWVMGVKSLDGSISLMEDMDSDTKKIYQNILDGNEEEDALRLFLTFLEFA